jgi:histidinol-phosphate/aromatic aminotransferase/cobyric acid decarboxylase-like protein
MFSAVLAALRAIERTDTAFYPDYGPVTALVERSLGVGPGWVQLTNGLDEGLHVAAQAAARDVRDATTLIVEPAFEMYAACADAAGLRQIHVPPPADLSFPLDDVMRAIDGTVRLISVTDPGNPTGLSVPAAAIARMAEAAPQAIVFVDEAYADFSGRTADSPARSSSQRRRRPDVRQGVRTGGPARRRSVCPSRHARSFRRLLPPYSLNIAAVRALEAAIGDRAYLDWYVGESVQSRQLIYDFCRRAGLAWWPSEGELRARARRRRSGRACRRALQRVASSFVTNPGRLAARAASAFTAGVAPTLASASPPWRTSLRLARIDRQTTETRIRGRLNLDGRGKYRIRTGLRFLDHMLETVARHGGFDLESRGRRRS